MADVFVRIYDNKPQIRISIKKNGKIIGIIDYFLEDIGLRTFGFGAGGKPLGSKWRAGIISDVIAPFPDIENQILNEIVTISKGFKASRLVVIEGRPQNEEIILATKLPKNKDWELSLSKSLLTGIWKDRVYIASTQSNWLGYDWLKVHKNEVSPDTVVLSVVQSWLYHFSISIVDHEGQPRKSLVWIEDPDKGNYYWIEYPYRITKTLSYPQFNLEDFEDKVLEFMKNAKNFGEPHIVYMSWQNAEEVVQWRKGIFRFIRKPAKLEQKEIKSIIENADIESGEQAFLALLAEGVDLENALWLRVGDIDFEKRRIVLKDRYLDKTFEEMYDSYVMADSFVRNASSRAYEQGLISFRNVAPEDIINSLKGTNTLKFSKV